MTALPDDLPAGAPGPARLVSPDPARERYGPLIEKIGLRGAAAQGILERLSRLHDGGARNPWFRLWRDHCAQFFDLDAAEAVLAEEVRSPAGTRLFLAHSYGRIVLTEFVGLAPGRPDTGSPASLYGWVEHLGDAELAALRRQLRRHIAAAGNGATGDPGQLGAIACSDFLAAVYQEMFPPALRRLLGEYYTPSWLVEYCIDQALRRRGETTEPLTILDPAAGSGSFLAHCIARLGANRFASPVTIIGFDVNPLAVDFCRANAGLAAAKAYDEGHGPSFAIQIHIADAVADPLWSGGVPPPPALRQATRRKDVARLTAAERRRSKAADPHPAAAAFQTKILGHIFQRDNMSDDDLDEVIRPFHRPAAMRMSFLCALKQYASDAFAATRAAGAHIVAGNPPWIAWDGLSRHYRDRLAPQWAASTLTVNTGWRAKVAAGKTELSSLFVYRAAERHAAADAVMVFVLPLSLFQSHLSGAGFRTFLTASGRHFALVALDDFSGVKVFPDAVNRTAVGTFAVDRTQRFPIRYATWRADRSGNGGERLTPLPSLGGPLVESEPNAPIVAFGQGRTRLEIAAGRSDYRARGGVNTGGANTILWLDVLARRESVCEVRNIGKSLRGSSQVIVAGVESDAVYPLLRGADMRRWQAVPGKSILLFYAPDHPKKALPLDCVQRTMPKAYAFVSRFREQLEGRKEYHRWGCAGPFYEVYRIGPYTFSPIKVAWQHTGYRRALSVSVIDDRGRRPAIPDQKVILIPFDDIEEAHYVCAVLASSVTAALLDRYLGADASTHILDYVALRRFAPHDEDHRRLAALSVSAHKAVAAGAGVAPFEQEIDEIVGRLRRAGR